MNKPLMLTYSVYPLPYSRGLVIEYLGVRRLLKTDQIILGIVWYESCNIESQVNYILTEIETSLSKLN